MQTIWREDLLISAEENQKIIELNVPVGSQILEPGVIFSNSLVLHILGVTEKEKTEKRKILVTTVYEEITSVEYQNLQYIGSASTLDDTYFVFEIKKD